MLRTGLANGCVGKGDFQKGGHITASRVRECLTGIVELGPKSEEIPVTIFT